MTKQLFLCLIAGTLVIAPGCTKRTKSQTYRETIEILNPEQLERDRKEYKNRGIVLVASSPVPIVTGGIATAFGASICTSMGRYRGLPEFGIPIIIVGGAILGWGIYMLGQGIHDLAKAKKLRRIQMKEAAQKRKAEREAQRAQDAH